jgi:hypothetical protein
VHFQACRKDEAMSKDSLDWPIDEVTDELERTDVDLTWQEAEDSWEDEVTNVDLRRWEPGRGVVRSRSRRM